MFQSQYFHVFCKYKINDIFANNEKHMQYVLEHAGGGGRKSTTFVPVPWPKLKKFILSESRSRFKIKLLNL